MKFSVTAPDRSSMGFNTYCCAGRHWPGAKPVTVEVLDQDECPRIPHPTREGVQMLDPVRLGRLAWKEIQDCPLLSKNAAPDEAELTLPPANPTEQLKEENRKLKERLVEMDSRLKVLEAGAKRDSTPTPVVAPAVAPAVQEAKLDEPPAPQAEPAAAPAADNPPPAAALPARSRRGKG